MGSKTLEATEEDFTAFVVQLAGYMGWRVHHQRPARTDRGWRSAVQGDIGFPDLVMVRAPRLIFAELKSATGRLRPDQRLWLDEIDKVRDRLEATRDRDLAYANRADVPGRLGALEVYVWQPADIDEIRAVLAR